MDYAIFLLHSFEHHRRDHEPKQAMALAMKQAVPTVAASAITTVIGFAALLFMRFGVGSDLGLNLFNGVLLSFISVMVLLPNLKANVDRIKRDTTLINKEFGDENIFSLIVPKENPGKESELASELDKMPYSLCICRRLLVWKVVISYI